MSHFMKNCKASLLGKTFKKMEKYVSKLLLSMLNGQQMVTYVDQEIKSPQ